MKIRTLKSIVLALVAFPSFATAQSDVNLDGQTSVSDVPFLIDWLLNHDAAHGQGYVDFGLPSGTCWATCNLGAESKTEYGNYYAWGETSSKPFYDWDSYKWVDISDTTLTRYTKPKDQLCLIDDAASVRWGGLWQTPTLAQWTELRTYCSWSWAVINGVYGYRISRAGQYIFLPAAGYLRDGNFYDENLTGYYWSRELYANDAEVAYGLYMDKDDYRWAYRYRYTGRTIRPVFLPTEEASRYDVNQDEVVSITDIIALRDSILNR